MEQLGSRSWIACRQMDELFDVVSNRGFFEPYSRIEIF
jgi:hypothetical protein